MQRTDLLFGVLLLPFLTGEVWTVENNKTEVYGNNITFLDEKPILNVKEALPLGLLIDISDFSRLQVSGDEKKKQRRVRVRKWKDKSGKYSRSKNNKPRKTPEDVARHVLRNNEKVNLVRNKTMEILKNGLRILSAGANVTQDWSKAPPRVNESLLEKILSPAVSKQDVLLSATGAYKVPVGFKVYERKTPMPQGQTQSEADFDRQQIKRQSKNPSKSSGDDYDYEYDFLTDLHIDTANETTKLQENIDYESVSTDKTVGALLEQIVNALQNLTTCSGGNCSQQNTTSTDDPCQKWLNCRGSLDSVLIGNNHSLPSCPCTYPSSIFYDEVIWDRRQNKYFRWRDASSEAERLDIYKPGAVYCIRSLLTQGSLSLSSQQCCYDRTLRLLTRGSGAGTINFISPDISRKLHYTADILPWRLCKGDFTRYNMARYPNNGNDCPQNPDEQQYQLQVKLSKIY